MRRQSQRARTREQDRKEVKSLPPATKMAREPETSTAEADAQKVKVLFYMHHSVVKKLKHLAIELDKSNSELAEEFIKAGLVANHDLQSS